MSDSVTTLSTLRQLLAARFPQAERQQARVLRTGWPEIDEAGGGLPCGALTEIVCSAPSCGSQLLLGRILEAARHARGRVALIDAHDAFDPQSWPEDELRHLVWVRCRDVAMALRAADIVTRDANFAAVVVDLRGGSLAELRKTPASFWYRLQRSAEPSDLAVMIFTPQTTVASARLRLQLERSHALRTLEIARPGLAVSPAVQRQRLVAAG